MIRCIWPTIGSGCFAENSTTVVPAAVAGSLADLYRLLGVPGEALHVEPGDPERPANHGIPVERFAGESRFARRDCAERACLS
jgi:hypothetical protein